MPTPAPPGAPRRPRVARRLCAGPVLGLLLGAAPAAAHDDLLWSARRALSSGDPEAASAQAAAWLAEGWAEGHPRRPEAIAIYVEARVAGLGEGPALTPALQAAWEGAPEDDDARLALAVALGHGAPAPGACEALAALTAPAGPAEPALARALAAARRGPACTLDPLPRPAGPGAPQPDRGQPEAWLAWLQDRLSDGVIDATTALALDDFYQAHPEALDLPGDPFARGLSGPGLAAARLAAEAAAQRAAGSADPALAAAAARVLSWARVGADAGGAAPRTDGEGRWIAPPPPVPAELEARVAAAARLPPARARAALRAELEALPAEGPAAAAVLAALAELERAAGHPARALDLLRDAWRADPEDLQRANAFAWEAAVLGRRMEAGLEAVTAAIAHPPAFDPRAQGGHRYAEFLDAQAHELGNLRDTRGWLLHRLGRSAEARDELHHALLLLGAPSGTVHLHQGLVLHALGDAEGALWHLGRGLSLADPRFDEAALVAEGRAALLQLWPGRRWHPGGVDAWVAAQRPADAAPPPGPPLSFELPAGPDPGQGLALAWVGSPLPDLPLTAGGPGRLSAVPGWRVVELWAAWCAPCVEGLPGLRAFAEAHPELTVVVAAVDDAPPDWSRHLPRAAPLVTGWAGPQALQALGLPGVPATFLVDPAGEVRAARLGAWTDPGWMAPGGAGPPR